MNLRKFHKILGISLTPLLLLLSVTGLALLGRKDNLYSVETKKLLVALHTWEIAAKYTGSIVAFGLLTMVTTGLILSLRPHLNRMRAQRLKDHRPLADPGRKSGAPIRAKDLALQ